MTMAISREKYGGYKPNIVFRRLTARRKKLRLIFS